MRFLAPTRTGLIFVFLTLQTRPKEKCIRIHHCTNQIWHIFAKGLKAGQCYGYRVHGPHKPEEGHRFNPAKLLLDPYAKAISWLNWEHNEDARRLKNFVSGLAALRRDHPVFRRLDFFRGRPVRGGKIEDVLWLNTAGRKMTNEEWNSDQNQCFAMFLGGNLRGADGNPINDDFFLVCFNASHEPVTFELPTHDHACWNAIIRTDDESGILEKPVPTMGELSLEKRSIWVLFLELANNADRALVAEQLSKYISQS